MAYNDKSLARQTAGAASDTGAENITHLFIYRTTDSRATVEGANYFLPAYRRLVKGSLIAAMMAVGSTPAFEMYVVTASSSAGVTIVRGSATGLTDSTGGTAGSALALAATYTKQVIPVTLAPVANTQNYRITMPFACTLVSARFRVCAPVTTAAKAATFTATVAGEAVTGGVIALTSANCATAGDAIDATAISGAGATGVAGSTIAWTASSVTTFIEGDGMIEMVVKNNDLANALASLNAA